MNYFSDFWNKFIDTVNNSLKVTIVSNSVGSTDQEVVGNVADNAADSGNPVKVGGKYNASAPTYADGDRADLQVDTNGNIKVTLATAIAGEDVINDVLKVEQRFSASGVLTSGTAVKSGAGFLHTVTFSQNDAAPTAGTIDIYNNTAGSGTKLFSWTLDTTVFQPFSVVLDIPFSTGLYVDFTTTNDVNVVCSYR